MAKSVVSLQPSEMAVYAAASRIYAAYIASGHVTPGNEHDMIDRSLDEALQMAKQIEEKVQSDQEFG